MLFRSLRSLAGRALAAGAASALTLTLFNAAQPTLTNHQVQPGTLKDVKVTLTPVAPSPAPGPRAAAAPATAGTPTLSASPTSTQAGTRLQSGAVDVGGARFVGFSWPDADPGTEDHAVFMRARTPAGWSGWREVEQAGDGPDPTSSEYRPGLAYSDGQWLDAGTEEVQARIDPPAAKATSAGVKEGQAAATAMAAGGIEAHLITPDLTATPGTEAPQAGVATAATAAPRIISRAAWGAKESIRRASPDYSGTVKAAFVHHTVQSNRYSPSESAALIRSDYLYHVRTRGWNDIGYNFLVDRYGRVFEGRYGGITRAVLGAHSGGFNTNSTGVALLGTFTTAAPPARMLAALERLLAWKLDLTHVDPRGHTVLRSAGGANTATGQGARWSSTPSWATARPPTRPAQATRRSPGSGPSAGPWPGSGGPRSTTGTPAAR